MKKKIIRIILLRLLRIDNLIYRLISKFSVKFEDGIHPKHRLIKYHNFFIDNIDNRDTVLDIGCGNGYNTYEIAKKAKSVVGIDISEDNIRTADRDFKRDNIEYILGDATSYLFNKRFDVIILSNVLEHIENRIVFLKNIRRLGKKFLIRVPLIDREWCVLYKKEFGIEYRLDNTHYIEYTSKTFKTEVQEADFEIKNSYTRFGEIWAVLFPVRV